MNGNEIKEMSLEYNLQSWSKQRGLNPIPIEKAEGIYLWDYDGNRYTDMSSQLVNMNVGFGNKKIGDAIKEQVDKYCFISPSYATESRAKLAKMIIDLMPDNMGKVFFTNAGADANENAIKMARMYTGRHKVFSRYRSYHGSSFGAGNLTGEPRRYPLEPGIPGFVKFFDPYIYREKIKFESEEEAGEYYVAKLREQIIYEGPDSVAAIVMETITGSNGIIIPPKNYLPGVRKICDEFGIMMICDEVMAGWGRTGKMFAFENLFANSPKTVEGLKLAENYEDDASAIGHIAPSVSFGNEDFMKEVNEVVVELRDEGFIDKVFEEYGLDPDLHMITNEERVYEPES